MDFWLDAINTSKWNFPTLLRICDIAQRNKKMCFIRSSIEYHPYLLVLNSMISLQYYFSGLIIYGSSPHKLFFIKGNINKWLKNYTKIDLTCKQQRAERTGDTADIGPMKEQSLVTFTQASFQLSFRNSKLKWKQLCVSMDSHRFILVKNCMKYLGTEAMQVESLIRGLETFLQTRYWYDHWHRSKNDRWIKKKTK